jgi:hypothetical protein
MVQIGEIMACPSRKELGRVWDAEDGRMGEVLEFVGKK